MLAAVGAQWVIIGHSERRQYFGETDESVYQKTVAALEAGLKPIVCVGEMLADREGGQTEAVLGKQFADGIAKLTPEQFAKIVIAYEPVWAIGTGKTATPEIAEATHKFIRSEAAQEVRRRCGREAAHPLRRQREARQHQDPDGHRKTSTARWWAAPASTRPRSPELQTFS